jgi:TRAP-type mannitol/chloroaromatic compound transport system permease small subunit
MLRRYAESIASRGPTDHGDARETAVTFLLALSRGIDAVTALLGRFAWWMSLAMVLLGAENVIARYGYGFIYRTFGENVARALSNNTYFELQTLAYNIVFLLGAAYVFQVDGHVRVDILFSRLRERAKAWIDIVGIVVFLWPFCVLTIYFSQRYVASSWRALEVSPNAGGLARYPIKTLIVVAFALLMVQGLSQLIKHVAFLRGRPDSRSIYAAQAADAAVAATPAAAVPGGGAS